MTMFFDLFANGTTTTGQYNLFPIGVTRHVIFSVVVGIFFLLQFLRTKRWHQLILAFAVPFSLIVYIDSENQTLFHFVGVAEAVMLAAALVVSIVQGRKLAKEAKAAEEAKQAEEAAAKAAAEAAQSAATDAESAAENAAEAVAEAAEAVTEAAETVTTAAAGTAEAVTETAVKAADSAEETVTETVQEAAQAVAEETDHAAE